MQEEQEEVKEPVIERRKKYINQISLGNLISGAAFILSGVGVYATTYADAQTAKTEINNIKANSIKVEKVIDDAKRDVKEDIREVKSEVKEVRQDVQKILYELQRSRNARPTQ